MKKFSLLAVLVLSVFIIQSCKKSSTDDTTTASTVLYQAYVNGTLFTPTTTSTNLTYSAANKTKTFNCTASTSTGQIVLSIQAASTKIDSGFTVATYTADAVKINTNYYSLTNGVPTSAGTLKAGTIYISAVDSLAKTITGTFSFNQSIANYDSNNNIISVTNTGITSGQFNALPYKYIKQ